MPVIRDTDTTTQPARRSHPGRWLALLFWAAVAGVLYAVYSGVVQIPERFNPWAPLQVTAEPNLLTPYKLSRARGDPDMCLAALAQTGMQYEVLPDRETGAGCGLENAVRLKSAAIRFGAPLPLSCPLALSFAMWERHALQPATQAHFSQRLAAIDNLGSYSCRNVNRGEGAAPKEPATGSGARSRHATANALDVSAFTLASGKRISVAGQWHSKEAATTRSAEALWLDDVHAGACKYFKGVLGPDYNAVHRDHFHLETGGYGMCR
ncbi:MAG: extensin family protein [Pseudomonadota bacterium]